MPAPGAQSKHGTMLKTTGRPPRLIRSALPALASCGAHAVMDQVMGRTHRKPVWPGSTPIEIVAERSPSQ